MPGGHPPSAYISPMWKETSLKVFSKLILLQKYWRPGNAFSAILLNHFFCRSADHFGRLTIKKHPKRAKLPSHYNFGWSWTHGIVLEMGHMFSHWVIMTSVMSSMGPVMESWGNVPVREGYKRKMASEDRRYTSSNSSKALPSSDLSNAN